MHNNNNATKQLSSPTDSTSSGHSDLSSLSNWWSSGEGSASAPSSTNSASSGSPIFTDLSSSICASHLLGHSEPCMPIFPQTMNPSMNLRSSIIRPPHNPARYVALSTQHVYALPQCTPMLARVSVVDYRGNVLYDTFVLPISQIEDFRSPITGLAPEYLFCVGAMTASAVREQVTALLCDKIVIGHSLWIHFSGLLHPPKLLGITHPAINTRDVALFLPFQRSISSPAVAPLKSLVSHFMRRKIGRSYENPLEESRAALDLFRSYEDPWEDEIRGGGWPCALPPSYFSRHFS